MYSFIIPKWGQRDVLRSTSPRMLDVHNAVLLSATMLLPLVRDTLSMYWCSPAAWWNTCVSSLCIGVSVYAVDSKATKSAANDSMQWNPKVEVHSDSVIWKGQELAQFFIVYTFEFRTDTDTTSDVVTAAFS